MRTADEIEREQHERFREQLRERDRKRFSDPERDHDLVGVWVAFLWAPYGDDPAHGEWLLAGFRLRKNRRKPQTMGRFFAKVRRQLNIAKTSPVMLMDLDMATRRINSPDQFWRYRPPQYQARKPKMVRQKIKHQREKKPRKIKDRALRFSRTTRYIALGRNGWDRHDGHLYLGPLASEQKRQAQFEAKRLFPVYGDVLVIGVDELSKSLRGAMMRGKRVKAGVTRVQWPEVAPTFEAMWARFAKRLIKHEFHDAIDMDNPGLLEAKEELLSVWESEGRPWLNITWFRKHTKS